MGDKTEQGVARTQEGFTLRAGGSRGRVVTCQLGCLLGGRWRGGEVEGLQEQARG